MHLGLFFESYMLTTFVPLIVIFFSCFLCFICISSYVSIGRFLYSPDVRKPQQLGGGLESWRGFYQSIRPTQMGLSLNIG